MALSRRLEKIISLVPPGCNAVDIGTDHGLVPAALAERGICPRVIATDLRPGPLDAARSLMRERGLTQQVELRLGDGLAPITPGEAEVIIIAGMGGALMQHILRDGTDTARAAKRLILSPQSELEPFRHFLQAEGYFIDGERLIEEDGKYYFILSVTPRPGEMQDLTPEELNFGKNTAPEDRETLQKYLQKEKTKAETIRTQLAGRPGEAARSRELAARLQMITPLLSHTGSDDRIRKERSNMSSKLGFGLMRLPRLEDGTIDIAQCSAMVDHFLENGGTYFDTAYVYEGSEEAAKKFLVDRHPRESYTLATKMNTGVQPRTAESTKQQFYTSLDRTGAGYFDYYLLHALGTGNLDLHREFDTWQFIADRKAEGLIKHCGFSFHDTPEVLDKTLTEHPEVDFVQLQINYADWENPDVQSRGVYETARRHGKQVVIMEPVKGGTLATLPDEAAAILKGVHPEASLASWGIRFAASLDGVLAVLSGMSTLDQVKDNMSYMGFDRFVPLNDAERKAIDAVNEVLAAQRQIGCTACKYCVEGCPMQINIPGVFSAYNFFLRFTNKDTAVWRYKMRTRDGGKASDCIRCGACEEACPQHLPIRDLLEEAAGVLD